MHLKKKIRIACSAIVIVAGWATVPAGAESLTLSYALEVRRDALERVSLPSDYCNAPDWLNSIPSCRRNGDEVASAAPEESGVGPALGIRRATATGTTGNAPPAAIPHRALQTGEDSSDSRLRLPNSSRTADVSLRLGSKNRLPSAEENRELPRFVDAPYESYLHGNSHKAIGLELLVPFQ